jgi:predicted metal-dependent hydrolase
MTPEQRYERADKDIAHYQKVLAGAGLTREDRRRFRCALIGAHARRWHAYEAIEQQEVAHEVGIAA